MCVCLMACCGLAVFWSCTSLLFLIARETLFIVLSANILLFPPFLLLYCPTRNVFAQRVSSWSAHAPCTRPHCVPLGISLSSPARLFYGFSLIFVPHFLLLFPTRNTFVQRVRSWSVHAPCARSPLFFPPLFLFKRCLFSS